MKFHGLLFLFVAIVSSSVCQDFEGKIVYKNTYTSKVPNVSNEQFNTMMGTTQLYLLKDGNYKSSLDGTMMQWQLYRRADNRIYMKMSTSPAVYWKDASENPDVVEKYEINKGVVTILGHLCDELILTCKSGVQKYYFSSRFAVDPKVFAQHKFGNMSEVVSKTKSMPLKIIIETPQFTIESTASEIKAEKVDEKEFELPEGSQLQKSPY